MNGTEFRWSTNFAKGGIGAIGGVALAIFLRWYSTGDLNVTADEQAAIHALVTVLAVAAYKQVKNWFKHHPSAPCWLLFIGTWLPCAALVMLAWCVEGCNTRMTHALTIDADGGKQELTQWDWTPPLGKMAEGAGSMKTHLGADGSYDVATGQSATDVDNTGQAAMMKWFFDALMEALKAQAVPKPGPTFILPPVTP